MFKFLNLFAAFECTNANIHEHLNKCNMQLLCAPCLLASFSDVVSNVTLLIRERQFSIVAFVIWRSGLKRATRSNLHSPSYGVSESMDAT